ncbi:MAG: lipocalin [Betaproteobacteria bacterium]|nr:lipocalin [Betaproteobacteria bacterium]
MPPVHPPHPRLDLQASPTGSAPPHPGRHRLFRLPSGACALAGLTVVCGSLATSPARASPPVAEAPALQALPALAVAPYMGRWYQVAYYPNFFQRQCVADTTATYRELPDGTVEVLNRCRTASGTVDQVLGTARPVAGVSALEGGQLRPARLEVSFLPRWLRWTGVGWGAYWVVDRPEHGRYAIVSEGRREYLWVLSRTPQLSAEDRLAVRSRLQALGFDLERLKDHPQEEARR